MTDDLEKLFQESAALAEQGAPPPGDTLGKLRGARTAERRRRWALLAIPVAAAAAVATVAVTLGGGGGGGGSLVPADGGDTVAAQSPPLCVGYGGASCSRVEPVTPTARPTRAPGDGCTYRPTTADSPVPGDRRSAGRDVGLPPPTPGPQPGTAVLHTNRGDITIALRAQTPCTVNSFTHLVRHAYYDGTPCHRLTTAGIFILQCGDPSATGTGGPGYTFDDEDLQGARYPAGTVAMANSGPGTNGSQFFLVYKDTQLDPNYTVFGRITSGLSVLEDIAAAGSTPANDGRPKLSVEIRSVTLD